MRRRTIRKGEQGGGSRSVKKRRSRRREEEIYDETEKCRREELCGFHQHKKYEKEELVLRLGGG